MRRKIIFAIISLFVFAIYSCDEENFNDQPTPTNESENTNPTGMTVLGEKLENPYSVENMKKALEELKATNKLKSASTEDFEIETTHLYVRFLPKDDQELSLLKQDTLLDIFDYPLDYEIISEGLTYHDPTLPDSAITWQYTVVAPDYNFPNIKYEVLAELFLIEEKDEEQLKSASIDYFDWATLEDKALEITDNLDDAEIQYPTLKKSKWRPAGKVTANGKPVVGCMVRARRWFTIHKGYTNNNGNFSCSGRFRRSANYSIKWERHYWDIRSGTWGQAYYNGPKRRGSWNLNITGGKSLRYAYIHQAAYDYFYRNPFGTQKPFNKEWYRSTLKIGYYDKYGNEKAADYAKWRNWFTFPHIRIYKGGSCDASMTDIYASTIHELAHSAHWQLIVSASGSNRYNDFIFADKKLKESWAVGMQTLFTRHFIYRYYDRYNKTYSYTRNNDYSEIVLELIEQAGYNISELEQCLIKASNLNEWQKNIKNKIDKDEKVLDNIFNRY